MGSLHDPRMPCIGTRNRGMFPADSDLPQRGSATAASLNLREVQGQGIHPLAAEAAPGSARPNSASLFLLPRPVAWD